ncbi:MAG: heavy metal translocating P-type ATPase [Lachnospiraceae bacterium]|nr:heavy metal translocating P-type ATPase [Lachnospiraceae bacterium]
MTQYIVIGMSCAACQARVEKAVSRLPGVDSVSVSLLTNSMGVEGSATSEDVIRAVEGAGYGARLKGSSASDNAGAHTGAGTRADSASYADTVPGPSSFGFAAEEEALRDHETPKLVRRLVRSLIFLLILMYITMGHNMLGLPIPAFLAHNHIGLACIQMLLSIVVMYINRDFFISGFRSLFHRSPNMDTLVALGSSVSFGWSLYVLFRMTAMVTSGVSNADLMDIYHEQLYFESAAMIPALITVGKTLESLSKGRTTDALKALIGMAPKTATVERDGVPTLVGIDEVRIGDVFSVKPGESIPVDGVIIEGTTAVDESALTGESIPVDKTTGDNVSAATINKSGFFRAEASRVGEDTTFSQIIRMVSDAAATKAPIARIADRVSGIFVPAVMAVAFAVFVIWQIIGGDVAFSLERAISVLVISCPCALGLATPVAIMVGSGVGAKNGILFKTAESLETVGKTRIMALDKTGTITAGHPEVTDIIPVEGISEDELFGTAYLLEARSEHPLARAIVEAVKEPACPSYPVTDWQALPGNGISAVQNGQALYAGSGHFIRTVCEVDPAMEKTENELSGKGRTPLFFAKDGKLLGIIAVADVIKEDSARAIGELRRMGIEVIMLTGDNGRTAQAIGAQAGVDRVIAGVLPDGKEAVIRELQKRGKVAMVGDGINDAPALTRADTGIAIGAGADVAVDSADVVLMNSGLADVSAAVRLSRGTLRNIYENLFWAFAYNIVLIPMAAGLYPGIHMNPMWGAAAMSLSSFTVCMNALRLNLIRVHDSKHDRRYARPALRDIAEDTVGTDTACGINKEETKMTKTLKVDGMMCEHCEARVKKALEAIEGVESATADHNAGTAVVTLDSDVADDVLREAVTAQDYKVLGIE